MVPCKTALRLHLAISTANTERRPVDLANLPLLAGESLTGGHWLHPPRGFSVFLSRTQLNSRQRACRSRKLVRKVRDRLSGS